MNIEQIRGKLPFALFGIILALAIVIPYELYRTSNFRKRQESKNEKFGFPYNDQRVSLGIPTIKKNWYTKELSFEETGTLKSRRRREITQYTQKWSSFKDSNEPYHKEKVINLKTPEEIATEIDRFENVINDTLIHILETAYFFGIDLPDANPWVFKLKYVNTKDSKYPYKEYLLTRNQLDSVLSVWNLNIN